MPRSPSCSSPSRRRSCRSRSKCVSASRCSSVTCCQSLIVIPLVTHGITFISRFQFWTQPIWIVLHLIPFVYHCRRRQRLVRALDEFSGARRHRWQLVQSHPVRNRRDGGVLADRADRRAGRLPALPAGARAQAGKRAWWIAYLAAGPGWIIPGMLKLLAGSFLAFLAIEHLVPLPKAVEPTRMYLVAFGYVFSSPQMALAFTGAFVVISQLKINVTNAYAGSIAWSNFFSRLTHSHPGRVVWLVFNVTIALMLMELGIFKMLEHALGLYSIVAVSWVGALVADLVINKPLGLSPPGIEFKRAHLYDINPVGVGAMLIATVAGIAAFSGISASRCNRLSAFVGARRRLRHGARSSPGRRAGRYYIARAPRHELERPGDDPLLDLRAPFRARGHGALSRLFRRRSARCAARWRRAAAIAASRRGGCRTSCSPGSAQSLPPSVARLLNTHVGRYLGVLVVVRRRHRCGPLARLFPDLRSTSKVRATSWRRRCGRCSSSSSSSPAWRRGCSFWRRRAAAWPRRRPRRQTDLLMNEIEAHKRTDAGLQKAKEVAEAANKAKSRHVVGLSHELRRRSMPSSATRSSSSATRRSRRADQRHQGHASQRRASVRPDRRPARYLQDRSGPLSPQPQRGAAVGFPRPDRRHVPPAGDRQGHRIPSSSGPVACRPWSRPTKTGCGRS